MKWLSGNEYQTCVKNAAQEFVNLGLISSSDKTTISSAIGSSSCGS